jgi:hypothetical protein
MSPEGALITGVLVLSGVVGTMATVEMATTTVNTALHAVDTGEHVAQDLGMAGGGFGGGVTVTVALRRNRKGGGGK